MSAELRQSYLQAMGVALFVPRFVLPGAAPSTRGEYSAPSATAAETAQEQSDAATQVPPPAQAAASSVADQQAVRRSLDELSSAPSVDSVKPAAALAESITAPAVRFNASLVDSGIGLRMVADCSDGALSPAQKRLMANISRALARRWRCEADLMLSAANFEWPLVKLPGLLQGGDEAREALSARLLANVGELPLRAVLLFGDSLQKYVCEDYLREGGAVLIQAPALQQLLDDGSLKAPLWSALKAIAAGD